MDPAVDSGSGKASVPVAVWTFTIYPSTSTIYIICYISSPQAALHRWYLDIYMNVNCLVSGVTTQISCNSSQPNQPSPPSPAQPSPDQDSQQWQDWYTRSTHLSSVLCLGQNQTNKNPAWQPLVSLLRLLAPSFRSWRCGEWKTGTNECIKSGTRYPNNHSV